MKLNFIFLTLLVILAVSNVIKPTSAQNISPIMYTTSCCNVTMTSEINPKISSYFFNWFVSNTVKEYQLGAVGLDGRGTVRKLLDDKNPYKGTYEIKNSPTNLSPINAPFNTTLVFRHNQSLCGLVFIVRASPLQQNITIPCNADCDILNGALCPMGCFCDQAATTQPQETTEILQTAEPEQTTKSSIIKTSISPPFESKETTIISSRTPSTNETATTETTPPKTHDYHYKIIIAVLVPVVSISIVASIVCSICKKRK